MIHLDRIDSWNHSFIHSFTHSLILWIKQIPVLGAEGNRNLQDRTLLFFFFFLMWSIFKVFIDFVTIFLLF